MRSSVRLSAALLCISLLTACGGGGGGSAPVPGSGGSSPTLGSAAMSFFIPSSGAPAGKRRSNALPAATQSVEVNVVSATATALNPPVAPAIFNVSATASGCQTATGGFTCTENVTVPFGNLIFAVAAYAGQNATGAVIAVGTDIATIGSSANNVAVTMTTESIYAGVDLAGTNIGLITIDHTGNAFSVAENNPTGLITGTVSTLPNGDLKLLVTSSTDPSTVAGDINYARELTGSVLLFASTNLAAVQATGGVTSGGDMGAAVGLQGCPTTGSSSAVTLSDIGGPAWSSTPTTSPAYTNGTAVISISGGLASIAFNGAEYSTAGVAVKPQTGAQTCSSGIYTETSNMGAGAVTFSPDGVVIVESGGNGGGLQPTDVEYNKYGFVETITAGSLNTTAIAAATYDGFIGGFQTNSGNVIKAEQPYQLQPVSGTSMTACPYSAFETQTTAPASAGCVPISFGSQGAQPGVVNITATVPSVGAVPGVAVIGQTSGGKYVIFGNVGGTTIEFLQH